MAKNERRPGGAPEGGAERVHQDTVGAEGAALHVEGIGEAAVALGEAVATKGPPAVGEGQVAGRVDGPAIETTKLLDAGDRRRAASEPIRDGETIRSFDVPARPIFGTAARETVAVARGAGRHRILPLGGPVVDPDKVPGRKVVTAAAQVRHDGVSYVPGETFTVDFRAHSELVPIGAIVATPWHDLPDHEPTGD